MEQFLAVRRARLSESEPIIQKALNAKERIQAKVILNPLKEDHKPQWDQMVQEVALEGLRAKFNNNRHLADYLCDTKPLLLGEASQDKTWGIGMSLEEDGVLDNSKWYEGGNLLGHSLMTVRDEIMEERNNRYQTA